MPTTAGLAPTTPPATSAAQTTQSATTATHIWRVAGVTQVWLREPEDGRDTISSMNRSATGTAALAQPGSIGTGRSGTRVKRLAIPGSYGRPATRPSRMAVNALAVTATRAAVDDGAVAGYLRFRRTLRLAPGIRLNLSKSGLSTSFGPRGLHYTVGHGRRRATVGIPGTGVSYTTYSSAHARAAHQTRTTPRPAAAGRATPAGQPRTTGLAALAALTPPQKVVWGIVYTLLVITSPIGLWLLVAGLWQLHVPTWKIRTYVHRAARRPREAAELLGRAQAIDPHSAEVLGPLAELKRAQGDRAAALQLYREYCAKAPDDWLARGNCATVALQCNQVDEAIADLVALRQSAPTTDDSTGSVVAHLAYAYLCKEDPQQAVSLVESVKARSGALGPGSQQCLFYHAVARYMLGNTDRALADLDRLYAVNPRYDGLQAVKDAMREQSYELILPDGTALVPVNPGHATRSTVKVQRTAPRSTHCENCQAPLPSGAADCPYCHAATTLSSVPPPPPPPPPTPPSPLQ
jgi:tetratricopeptide (TPR) repeat protein